MKKEFKILLFYPNHMNAGLPPSNLAILAAYLKEEEFNVKLFDTSLYKTMFGSLDDIRIKLGHVKKTDINKYISFLDKREMYNDFIKVVEEYKPNLIGITLVDSTIKFSLDFIEKIKDKNIPVVTGGVGTTFLYERILNTGLVDYACIGEGEEALVELANKLYKNEDTSKIKNIYQRDKNGNIIKNSLRRLININELLIPDFSIYDNQKFYRSFMGKVVRMAQMDLDRGCPWVCTYCASPSLKKIFNKNKCGPYYRFKNLDKIFDEIKFMIKEYNLDFVWLSSETLLALKIDKFREFAERYKKEINLPFWCQSRLDTFTEEKTKLLAEMGCKNISVGLEHGDEQIRNGLLDKKITNKQIIKAVKIIKKYGIFPTLNNMIGLPDETRENIFTTIELNRKISEILGGKHNINVFTFVPFSGTKLKEISLEKGYIKDDGKIPFSYLSESILTMPSLSKEEIRGLERTVALYIKLPKSYWPDIKIAEKFDERGEKMFNKLINIMNK